jgi:hypothetical protein
MVAPSRLNCAPCRQRRQPSYRSNRLTDDYGNALANPAKYADFVIAFEGDAVSTSVQEDVQKKDLIPLAVIRASGEPKARSTALVPRPVIICANLAREGARSEFSSDKIQPPKLPWHSCNTYTTHC